MSLLLTSVFGPFGVDDQYGRKENKIELFHNQVTREQGLFSYRFWHASFGLHLLAENVSVPTTVLDFPTRARFIAELRRGYDHVGISFIVPNFKKAQAMAALVREHAPTSAIILGGHGTSIPGVETLIEHDHICRGEGVAFLRTLLGEEPQQPVRHPIIHSSHGRSVLGVPLPDAAGVLIPGVGCANKCRFCATSHFFDGHTPYLAIGRDLFAVCQRYERELGVTDFGVLDENYLKLPQRALELRDCLERSGARYTFGIFSSAETLTALGDLDLLARPHPSRRTSSIPCVAANARASAASAKLWSTSYGRQALLPARSTSISGRA